MSEIQKFQFRKTNFEQIKQYRFGKNWPVVYILENENTKEAYVGQTVGLVGRMRQHYDNLERIRLNNLHVITDEEYNVSATLDIESALIRYMAADGKYVLQNGNEGLKDHEYFDRQRYKAKFDLIWKKLQEQGIAINDLEQIKNSDLFKYSPYKALTDDQMFVTRKIFDSIKLGLKNTFIINGKPGTGKTILAVYLLKYLTEQPETRYMKIGFVVPMGSLRRTLRKVCSKVKGLKGNMVIGPNDVVGENYDLLIVDEAHRLRRRTNIVNYRSFDIKNAELGLDKNGNELDWILMSSKYQVLFYDSNQSVRPSDIRNEHFIRVKSISYDLVSQMRIGAGENNSGGEEYVNFIEDLFDLKKISHYKFGIYDIKVFDNIETFVDKIREKENYYKLSRIVAGYAWEWKSRQDKELYDIEIDNVKLRWNSQLHDWVNSKNAINEVGCIHTIQGYDLNYVGVIIGPELGYDPVNHKLIIRSENYKDSNGFRGITDEKELRQYIINIYKTLLTRGIKGTYIYTVDDNLRKYLMENIDSSKKNL